MQRMKNSVITLSDFRYSSLSLYLLCIESIKEDGGLCGKGLGFVGVAGTSVQASWYSLYSVTQGCLVECCQALGISNKACSSR